MKENISNGKLFRVRRFYTWNIVGRKALDDNFLRPVNRPIFRHLSETLRPKQCPNCNEPNKPDSRFCAKCRKLAITGYAIGIGFGIATDVIAFVVLFLPAMMGATPTQMMNPAMSSQMIMTQLQKMEPMILAGATHIIYGAILGAITRVLITKIELRRIGDEGYRQRNLLRR